jgi:hypothetical protein
MALDEREPDEIEECDCRMDGCPVCDWPCRDCEGEGWVWGDTLGDPLWYVEDELYKCRNCGGSGLAADMTSW